MALIKPDTVGVILCAAAVTYLFRFGGLMISEKLPNHETFTAFMEALPGTILIALIIPGIVTEGLIGVLAASGTAVCTYKTGNVFLSMVAGMGIVAAGRYLMLL